MEMDGVIAGFERVQVPGDGITVDALVGGEGPPLLLLHGYPQTRMIWKKVAPVLARSFTLVIPDLRGYGRSEKPLDETRPELYCKRQMARDQLATMRHLGFDSFHVAGHDRGARVAYRLAFDYPEAVKRLAVIDIIPTLDLFAASGEAFMGMFHWSFLAQPYPLPEMLLEGRADRFALALMQRWVKPGFKFDEEALEDYLLSNRNPAVVRAGCDDYRAAWLFDRLHDQESLAKGQLEMPVLALWGAAGAVGKASPLEIWARWAKDLCGEALPAGHFVPEEAPEETARALRAFFS
ncbi:alpha/beta fold hydrolase [Marinobacterium lutimaris]|uniref:Haloacetate dehalogenase n=1 Tax=Marinobacterium lutimaris TaxID=568106 RepID=A0A1H6C029_9GAMM|nr:alpha/beta hydrolase [Marinobacterium lutimaris]SEG66097.1 haloacetate dehalogenase [Marinobacterium lutimaris]